MRKLLMVIPIYVVSMALPGFWKGPQPQPCRCNWWTRVPRAEYPGGHRQGQSALASVLQSLGQMSNLLIQEGQWVEAIVHLQRESGK
jgi:hypothetical protein